LASPFALLFKGSWIIMEAIIIGAGRGTRLKEMTDIQPKCYVPIRGKRIIDWILDALGEAGLKDPVFIGGYLIDIIKSDYPDFSFCVNEDWPNNNILASMFYAEPYMDEGFVCSYSDILYKSSVVEKALDHPGDIVLCVDTNWRERYVGRTEHPEIDAEKLVFNGDVISEIHRDLAPEKANAEYIGVAKFSPKGAKLLKEHYHRVRKEFTGKPWREAAVFEKAYKILLFQEMIERGVTINCVATHGDYIEIDTQQDFDNANNCWN